MNKKTFYDVKQGDTVYKVCCYDYKTRIIKKTVKSIRYNIDKGKMSIQCECKDSEQYANFFASLAIRESMQKDKYTANTYICTNLEDAKAACTKLAEDIVSKTKKNLGILQNRLDNWHNHLAELTIGNFEIK
jgi:hypothetical protein